ncbi:MAG: hypothetical protein IJO59_05365 [Clostridia bacterium]|nr:hypothetical protein [Clostridia bacterium]
MNLNGVWRVTGLDEQQVPFDIDAQVPGCIHTDLWRTGRIADPYYRDNAKTVQWIEKHDFTYARTFTIEKAEPHTYVEFDGLDTYATVYLNGVKIGESDNMFYAHAFLTDGVLRVGENRLEVRFRSPVREVEGCAQRPAAFTFERLYTRRMQCTYGWDWVDRFVTMGIYKDVRLEVHRQNDIDHTYVYTADITPDAAQVKWEVTLRDFADCGDRLHLTIYDPAGNVVLQKTRTILQPTVKETVDIPKPQLWYPHGYGAQPLYKAVAETATSRHEVTFGIRKITVLQLRDGEGSAEQALSRKLQEDTDIAVLDHNEVTSSFSVLVNDVNVFCKGACWVPCEPFPSAECDEKIEQLLRLSADGGVNMVRVWGGGLFEKDAFYDACDRLGILVTQDFLMACGQYPEEDEWFIAQLQKETAEAARRLRNHACLAWWSGDNENAVHGDENSNTHWGYRAATYGIEPVLGEWDPHRYFFPSSPYGGDKFGSVTVGTAHNTNYLGAMFDYIQDTDCHDYRDYFSHFISRFSVEQASMGMPFASCLQKFLTDEDIYGDDQSMSEFHTKNNNGLKSTLFNYVNTLAEKVFGTFQNGEDRVRKQQEIQCEWVRLTMEAHRRHKGYTSGILYWMLNDCWPSGIGWSLIDYYGNPKPSYYTFKRCAKAVIGSLETVDGVLRVHACNDGLTATNGKGHVYLYDFVRDECLWEDTFSFAVAANASAVVYATDYGPIRHKMTRTTMVLCDLQSEVGDDRCFFLEGRFADLALPVPTVRLLSQDETSVTVQADSFVPYLLLDIPDLAENCLMMKPGESKTISRRK